LYGSETINSSSFTAFLKDIADIADLLKQMWFLLTIEIYKQWHKGTLSGQESFRNFDEDINERATTDVVNVTMCSALLKCTMTEYRTWAAITELSLYTKLEP
jgi:hypothetical protein